MKIFFFILFYSFAFISSVPFQTTDVSTESSLTDSLWSEVAALEHEGEDMWDGLIGEVEKGEDYMSRILGDLKFPSYDDLVNYTVKYINESVRFWLYTKRTEPGFEEILKNNITSILNAKFNFKNPTKILIHGWINAGYNHFCEKTKNAYLMERDFNIIAVDWSKIAYNVYPFSRFAINYIGPYVAEMLDFLIENTPLQIENVHVLGHSLGAHIAGLIGKNLKNGPIKRITGMDPAYPLFGKDPKMRLDKSDADFVDVIHTSANFLGYPDPIGDVDFYPNGGGPHQPGCGFEIGVCTHKRSYLFYIESIFSKKGFVGYKCNSWDDFEKGICSGYPEYMGDHVSNKARGVYYLRTAEEPPFALGYHFTEEKKIKKHSRMLNHKRKHHHSDWQY